MTRYLIVQVTYEHLEIGFFQNGQLIAFTQKEKNTLSTFITQYLDNLLEKSSCLLGELSFIGVNLGPAPLTSLRSLLSFTNAISFAKNLPLVGVDGISSFVQEHATPKKHTIALFNAFSKNAYFGILSPTNTLEIGCMHIDQLLEQIQTITKQHAIVWIGQGVSYFTDRIEHAGFHVPLEYVPQHASLAQLGTEAYKKFIAHNITSQLLPLYTKKISA